MLVKFLGGRQKVMLGFVFLFHRMLHEVPGLQEASPHRYFLVIGQEFRFICNAYSYVI